MEIVLMRHGEPEFSAQQGSARVKATDMSGWIAGYDASGVTGEPDCHAGSPARWQGRSPKSRRCSGQRKWRLR